MASTASSPLRNQDFAALVGCDYTTASRLRNGQRLPSMSMFTRICEAFQLDADQRASFQGAIAEGSASCGRWVSQNLFGC